MACRPGEGLLIGPGPDGAVRGQKPRAFDPHPAQVPGRKPQHVQDRDVYRALYRAVEVVGRVAGDHQKARAHPLQQAGAFHHLRRGVPAAVEQGLRPVRDGGVVVDEHPQVFLVRLRPGVQYDLAEDVHRGEGTHPADHADRFLLHGKSSFLG